MDNRIKKCEHDWEVSDIITNEEIIVRCSDCKIRACARVYGYETIDSHI